MDNYKHSCVVDAEGFYRTLVLQFLTPLPEGGEEWVVQHYTLADGERLIDTCQPSMCPYAGGEGFVRPKWGDGVSDWTEGATAEEIAAWELEHPAPTPTPPSPQEDADALLVDHEYRLTILELGVN